MLIAGKEIPDQVIADFCRKWKIEKLSIFGSAARGDFGPESDVDFMGVYRPEVRISLLQEQLLIDELREITGRDVDFVEEDAVLSSPNRFRREGILASMRKLYDAAP